MSPEVEIPGFSSWEQDEKPNVSMDFGSASSRPTMPEDGQPSSSRAVSHAPSKAEPSSSVQPEEENNGVRFPSSTPAASDVPAKRRRISNGAEALGACTRHAQHWYADGSVVIRLKNTLFRVHSSRLATKSTFFSSLFERAPHGVYDVEEGVTCPVYHIVGVKPRDFDMLLTILDDPSEYMQADLPFKTLASILRATSVLEYAKLFRWACTLLEALWPPDLSAFSTDALPYASQTIVLARECGIASVRKRAYYELLRLPGFGQSRTAGDNKLTVEDYECLTCAREGCAEVWMGAVMRPPVEREQCANRTKNCLSNDPVRAFATYCATTRPLAKTFRHDPVAGFDELAEMPWRAGKEAWCRNCVKEWLEAWKREREELWRNLDMWLGLTT